MDFLILRVLRKSKKITLKEMAGKVGISPVYLSLIERNKKNPSVSIIEDICNELEDIQIIFTFKSKFQKE